MEHISSLSLEKHEGPYDKWPRLSRLYVDGHDTGKQLPGYVIEAQYRCAQGYLVITSHDCPYEESNDFLLLDARFAITATQSLVVPYSSFLIHQHWPLSDNAIRIHYYQDVFFDLRIEVSPAASRASFGRALSGVRSLLGVLRQRKPSGPACRLRLEKFEAAADDPACMASVRHLQERLEAVRAQLAEDAPASPARE